MLAFLNLPFSQSQTNSLPAIGCGMDGDESPSDPFDPSESVMDCSHSSGYYNLDNINTPTNPAKDDVIRVRLNLIFLKNSLGEGNFQEDNLEHQAFIDEAIIRLNDIYLNIFNDALCTDGVFRNTKIQFVDNRIFNINDNFSWNNDNCNTTFCCPNQPGWYIDPLDAQIVADPNIPRGINIYFTNDGSEYEDLVVDGSTTNFNNENGNVWCSQGPTTNDLCRTSKIHAGNVWLSYWHNKNIRPNGVPFSTSREWHLFNIADGLAHEIGHSFLGGGHVNDCDGKNIMCRASNCQDYRRYLKPIQVGEIHKELGRSNLRKFVPCEEKLDFPRRVTTDETWDFDQRLYRNVIVETGATLRITCQLLMPLRGEIIVERGARLIVDGGTITRANTCEGNEKWRGINVLGNNEIPHTEDMRDENSPLLPDNPGIVLLQNDAVIEFAKAGITTNPFHISWPEEKSYWNGFVYAKSTTFRNNDVSVGFMLDDKIDGTDNVNFSAFEDCDFINEDGSAKHGVTAWKADISFENCTFDDLLQQGLLFSNCGGMVKECTFNRNKNAIQIRASQPLAAELEIGGSESDGNTFNQNDVGVYSTVTFNLVMSNNDFDNNRIAFYNIGESNYTVTQNTFDNDVYAIGNIETGTSAKLTQCNTYEDNAIGMYNYGDNRGLQFDHETFTTLYDVLIDKYGTSLGLMSAQGTQSDARWNLFSENSNYQILSAVNGTTNNFFYWYPNPNISNRLQPLCSLNENAGCGITNNFVSVETSGNNPGCLTVEGPEENPWPWGICRTRACYKQTRARIQQKENALTQTSDPTQSKILKSEVDMLKYEKAYILNDLIKENLAIENYQEIEDILILENDNEARKKMIGLKLKQQNWAEVSSLLNSLPIESDDDSDFKTIQEINLDYLQNVGAYNLSTTDENTLRSLADKKQSSAAYAQGLLGILINEYYEPIVPKIATGRSTKGGTPILQRDEIKLTPNPASTLIRIELLNEENNDKRKITIFNSVGQRLKEIQIFDQKVVNLDVQTFENGVYFISYENGKSIESIKFIVNH